MEISRHDCFSNRFHRCVCKFIFHNLTVSVFTLCVCVFKLVPLASGTNVCMWYISGTQGSTLPFPLINSLPT